MNDRPDLSVIVVNWNTRELLRNCLHTVFRSTREARFDVWVVDNGSTDGSVQMVETDFPQANVIRNDQNLGFSRANNLAIGRSSGRYALLLNSDTEVPGNALGTMVRFMDDHPEAGVVGCRLLNPDGSLQLSCGHFPRLSSAFLGGVLANRVFSRLFPRRTFFAKHGMSEEEHRSVQEPDFVTGACLMLRREAIEETGPLDENIFLYFEEIELCYRMRQAGWKVLYTPAAQIRHYGGQSSKSSAAIVRHNLTSQEYFFAKHYGRTHAVLLRVFVLVGSAAKVLFFSALLLSPRDRHRQLARSKSAWHLQALGFSAINLFRRLSRPPHKCTVGEP